MRRLVLILLVAGCGSGKVAVKDVATGVPAATTEADADADGDADTDTPAEPCFETDMVPLFERTCGSGTDSCHAAAMYAADVNNGCRGWLSLEDRPLGSVNPETNAPTGCPDLDLYSRLTGLSSWQCYVNGSQASGNVGMSVTYVTPGDPDASYMWWKVDPTGELCDNPYPGTSSARMPFGTTITDADRETIRRWIELGAPKCATTPPTGTGPSCTITRPTSGLAQDYRLSFSFEATASDPEDGALSGASVSWSVEGISLGTGTSLEATLPLSGTRTVTCTATDSDGNAGVDTVEVTAISPWVEIWHPGDGEVRSIAAGDIPFIGYATDLEDGILSDALTWSDSVQGDFGAGSTLDWLPTPAGYHTITASVLDSAGNGGSASIQLDMVP